MRIDNLQKKQTFEFPIDNQRIIHMQFSFSEHSQGLQITKELAIKYVVLNLGNCKAEILIFLEKSLPQEFSKLFLPTLKVGFLVLKFSQNTAAKKLSLVFEFELGIQIEKKNILNNNIDPNLMSQQKLDLVVETKVFNKIYFAKK